MAGRTAAEYGAPAGYDELKRFLPKKSERRQALGVVENTITCWDHHAASRIRQTQALRVRVLVGVCERIEPHFQRSDEVGRFLLEPQLFLGGLPPAGVLRLSGWTRGDELVDIVERVRRVADEARRELDLDPVLSDDAAWEAVRAGLPDAALERVIAGRQATEQRRADRGTADALE